MPTVVLRHTDPGAPVLNGQDGSLYNILKWAAPQLGWSVAFDDPSDLKLALRNSALTGTGAYLQVTDKASLHDSNARMARVQGYLTMNGLDDGVGAWMDVTQRFWIKSRALTATAVDWLIIGDERTLYFCTRFDQAGSGLNSTQYAILMAGDFSSYKVADGGAFAIITSNTDALSEIQRVVGLGVFGVTSFFNGPTSAINNTWLAAAAAMDHSAAASGVGLHVRSVTGAPTSSGQRGFGLDGPAAPSVVSGGVNTAAVELYESATIPRGVLRGLLNPLHAVSGWSTGRVISGVGAPSGNGSAVAVLHTPQSSPLHSAGGGVGWVLFDLGDWL